MQIHVVQLIISQHKTYLVINSLCQHGLAIIKF